MLRLFLSEILYFINLKYFYKIPIQNNLFKTIIKYLKKHWMKKGIKKLNLNCLYDIYHIIITKNDNNKKNFLSNNY